MIYQSYQTCKALKLLIKLGEIMLKDELTKILNSCLKLIDVLNLNKNIKITLLKTGDNTKYNDYYFLFVSDYGCKAYFVDEYASFKLLEQVIKDKIAHVFESHMLRLTLSAH